MADFDPDAYLAAKGAAPSAPSDAFDPDAYLASKTSAGDSTKPRRGDELDQPDPSPAPPVTTPEPSSVPSTLKANRDTRLDALKQVGAGALGTLQTAAHGVNTLVGEALPVDVLGPNGFHAPPTVAGPDGVQVQTKVPFSGLADPSKRRELERGVSDAATFGLAEKAGNAVSDYLTPELSVSDVAAGKHRETLASTADQDAKNAPGYREGGALLGSAVPGAGDLAAAGVEKLSTATRNKLASNLLKNFGGASETAKATDKFVKELRPAVETLKSEVLTPEGLKIATAARANPEKALTLLQEHVGNISAPRKSYYTAVDAAAGGAAVDDYTGFLAAERAKLAKVNTPQAKDKVRVLGEMIDDAEGTWGAGNTIPSLTLREHVTGLQNSAGNVIGSINESERAGLMDWRAGIGKDYLDQHLASAAATHPEVAPVVQKINDLNRRVSAWLAPEDALKDRVGKLVTKSLRQSGQSAILGGTVGALEGFHRGGVGTAIEDAAAGAAIGAIGHRVVSPAISALGRAGLRGGAAVARPVGAVAGSPVGRPVTRALGALAAMGSRNDK